MKKLFLSLLLCAVSALAQPPPTTNYPLSIDENGNVVPNNENITFGANTAHASIALLDVDHGNIGSSEDFSATVGYHKGTLTESPTVTLSDFNAGPYVSTVVIDFIQDSTGGWNPTWPAAVVTAPTINPTANSVTRVWLETTDGGTTINARSDFAPTLSAQVNFPTITGIGKQDAIALLQVDHGNSGAEGEDFSATVGYHIVSPTASQTFTLSDFAAGPYVSTIVIDIVQDSTVRTITWPGEVVTAPSINPASGSITRVYLETTDGGITVNAKSDYQQIKSILGVNAGVATCASATSTSPWFTAPFDFLLAGMNGFGTSPDESDVKFIMPFAATVRNLKVRSSSGVKANSPTTIVTVRKNGSDTSVALTLTQTINTTSSDLVHSASFSAGDAITFSFVTTGASASSVSIASISVEVDQN